MPFQSNFEILCITHKYPPAIGGMEKQSFELIAGVGKLLKTHQIVPEHNETIASFFWKLNARICEKIKEHPNIRLIHFNDGLCAALSLHHKGYSHVKKVVTLHGLDVVFPLRYFQQRIIPRFMNFDLLITVSQATADAIMQRGISPAKVMVIPNGVDQLPDNILITKSRFQQKYPQVNLDKPYLITLGRPVKRKGFSWFIKNVLPLLPENVQLIMVGPFRERAPFSEKLLYLLPKKWSTLISLFLGFPSDEKSLRQLFARSEVISRVKHLGKIPTEDIQFLLRHAKAFLMPNITVPGDMEGFGLVCLEASLAGTIVLAANIDGIPDAVQHHKNGILIGSNLPLTWRNHIVQILANPIDYQELAEQYSLYTKTHYGWDIMAQAYAQAFRKLLRKDL